MNKRLMPFLVPLLIIFLWEIAVYYQILPKAQAASPSQIVMRFWQLLSEGRLARLSLFSLGRLIFAVSVGGLTGVAVGIWLALKPSGERTLGKTLQFFSGLPVVIWLPFGVMIFGVDEAFKISLTALSIFFLIYSHTFQTTKLISKEYLEVAAIFEKSFLETIREIIIPALLPAIFTSLRIGLSFAWVILFFVEYASASQNKEGIGWFIADARAVGRIEDEFAGLLMLGLLAYLFDIMVSRVQRYFNRWNNTIASEV